MDTERDGHRVSFNEVRGSHSRAHDAGISASNGLSRAAFSSSQAFQRKGLKHDWDVELYGELLEIGGGKERM